MNFNNLIFWLVFLIYWGDGYNCSENEQMQDIESVNKRTHFKDNLKSTFTLLSESITEAVNNDSKYTFLPLNFLILYVFI